MPEGPPELSFTIRPFATREEYEACSRFQEEIWGEEFNERVSPAMLKLANRIGGLAAGAYGEDGGLLGFVFGLTGVRDGELVHWSDMLAVRADLRDRGMGTALKAYQRKVLLSRGIRRMHWTFDPLQSRNAYVNFSKLGIVSGEFVPDMYGDTGSPLHGAGTDRLIATWLMDSERVARRMAGAEALPTLGKISRPPSVLPVVRGEPFPIPGRPRLDLAAPSLLLSVPRDIDLVLEESPEAARRWREATRSVFATYLNRGYRVEELLPEGSVSQYLLVSGGEEKTG